MPAIAYISCAPMRHAACPLCGGAFSPTLLNAKEMMFGTRESFAYRRCSACGALILAEPPSDLSPYYAEGYYSMNPPKLVHDGALSAMVKKWRANVLLRLPAVLVAQLAISERVPQFFLWLAGRGLTTSASVCDVGAGSGQLLYDMARQGFTRLLGIDPYLDAEVSQGPVRLERRGLDDLDELYDLIMLNHVFEHMSDPRATLTTLRDRLRSGGTIVIRVPVADSDTAETYGGDWVQLDPPRHLVVPTDAGMRAVAEACGLTLTRTFPRQHRVSVLG